jgi:hypothetical protein
MNLDEADPLTWLALCSSQLGCFVPRAPLLPEFIYEAQGCALLVVLLGESKKVAPACQGVKCTQRDEGVFK